MIDDWCSEDIDGYQGLEDDDVRYGLTALGMSVLEERPGFAGFGPCAASRPARDLVPEPKPEHRRSPRAPKRRSTPLFG